MGMTPEMAIYVSTYTPARRMKLLDRGSIAPGKVADFILLSDLDEVVIEAVYKRGVNVEKKTVGREEHQQRFPAHFYKSIKLSKLSVSDFSITTPVDEPKVFCRICLLYTSPSPRD